MKKKIIVLITIVIFLVSISSLIILGIQKKSKDIEKKVVEPQQEEYKLTLGMVGDTLYHGGLYVDGKNRNNKDYDFTHNLVNIRPYIEKYDLAFYNQESILGGTSLGLSTYPRFNSPQQVGDAYLEAGFNLVSLANNHTLDKGESGIKKSVAYWKEKDAVTAGSYTSEEERSNPKIHTKNNINYVLLAYTTTTNGLIAPKGKEYLVNTYSYDKVKDDIEKVRDNTDIIIVSMHWGDEYQHTPSKHQIKIAKELSSLGADIIIGHHPHVIQPIEIIDETVVFYSLGNFISGQVGIDRLIGLLGSVEIKKKVVDGIVTNVSIGNIKGDLTYTYKTSNMRNYTVYPFSKLTDEILPGYKKYKSSFEAYLNISNNPNIIIGSLK